jgi:LuxR family maltose regulon positive regulatory protein
VSAIAPSSGPVLVATKLHVPAVREGSVARTGLVARLVDGGGRKLAFLCAPAGWGKTVLLSEWRASPDEERPFAWVSLDPGDSDPVRFWTYVIAALRTIEPELGETALAALPTGSSSLQDAVVAPLLNDLAASSQRLVLVLDDYHLIHSEPIHASVGFLLRHLPGNVQLVIATRADPPLALAGLRAAGEIAEMRAAELRFTDTEADALLNGSLGLDRGQVGLLQARTEGWAAGLQLAALSVRSREDKNAFIESFSGDDRQIGDYLHEVLADQPASLRDFLLQTSILERMCAPLCDALRDTGDSAIRLEHAERSNLFLVALDSHREWYRYHHLFRDLLGHELARTHPELVGELHRRAAVWHADEGDADEAIAHATAAGDFDLACELIRTHLEQASVLGQFETVARWIDALPRPIARADTRLCARRAWCALHLGRLDEAASWRREFEPVERPPSRGEGETAPPEFAALAFDAGYAQRRGDVGQALEAAKLVVSAYPDETDPRHTYAEINLGEILFYAGQLSAAARCIEGAIRRLADAKPSPFATQALLHGHVYLATIRADLSELDQAERSVAEGERLIQDVAQGEHHPNAVFLNVARGKLLDLRGDITAAETSLARAEALHRRVGWPLDHAYTLLLLAGVKRRLRKHMEARALAREAGAVLRPCPDPGMLLELLARTERSVQLARAPESAPALPVDVELSERELTILRLLGSELSQREIGSELYISLNTVKGHVRSIFRKLGVKSRSEAVARGRELGLL